MTSTFPSYAGLDYTNINVFRYFIGISIGVVFLIAGIVIITYYCSRGISPSQPQQRSTQSSNDQSITIEVGLDEAALGNYPKFLYSEAKIHKRRTTTTNSCCSICLADYNSSDLLRLLPDCGHLFHLHCVDPWLRQHATCPLCRSSPTPLPFLTSPAEGVPLENQNA